MRIRSPLWPSCEKRAELDGCIGGSALESLERSDGVGGDALAIDFSGCAPGFPIEAEELVEQAGTFKSERNRGKLRQRVHLRN